jgi:hypothetical protein
VKVLLRASTVHLTGSPCNKRDWKLTPAYDLTPSVPVSQEPPDLVMDCGDIGRYGNAKNILSQHARFLLETGEAVKAVSDMKERVGATRASCPIGPSMRDVTVDPGGHALGKILHKTGSREYVMLTRVNDELRRHSQGS